MRRIIKLLESMQSVDPLDKFMNERNFLMGQIAMYEEIMDYLSKQRLLLRRKSERLISPDKRNKKQFRKVKI